MKTATVRELRNHYAGLMKWIEAGEEIRITRRGKAIARLVPEPETAGRDADWRKSPACRRERNPSERLDAGLSSDIVHDSSGTW
jgi:prevent-host-death family protein